MVFSSTVFLFTFLPAVLFVYYLCPGRWRNAFLLAASLVFYGWGEPRYIIVMVLSILFNYGSGLVMGHLKGGTRPSRLTLVFSVAGNLLILGCFKYADFFIENINELIGSSFGLLQLTLPIGISFYTFQAMSYVIDVYRGKVRPQRNILDFATYITLFPQLIAGPIVRYVTVEEQLRSRKYSLEQGAEGVRRFIIGLGKKVLLANQAGLLWTEISSMNMEHLPAVTAWLGAIAFTFQIYFDFSGYSDMAIGLGKLLGFEFLENFNYPYIAKSITEFWRRWHISLSTWFKEYLYIPLGGNRKGLVRQCVNIMIVWALTGFWHGASWNFLWWGIYFGLLLILEKVLLLKYLAKLPAWIQHLYALFLIVLGWVIFAESSGLSFLTYLRAMFGCMSFADQRSLYFLMTGGASLCIMALASTGLPKRIAGKGLQKLSGKPTIYVAAKNVFLLLILLLSTAFLVSDTYNPFLYFRF
ncbi:MBOAT family O-acyltransferase [Emergencia timonensis]|uniref:MBOAT family O-acyltransferase n=1 Tax=Emergencia timonensis TaxID=1776384 RepID=UPI0039918AB3